MSTETTERQTETSQPHDVFVSYARQDQAFVRRLTDALAERGKRAWVDWVDIPPTAEWMAEIRAAIDAADTYVVVLSPASIASKVCAAELDSALSANKRIVPVVAVTVEDDEVPSDVAKLNWVSFTEGFDPALEKLLVALDTDLDHVKAHTRLQVKAREWETKDESRGLLLRGAELKESEAFLVGAQGKDPRATALQARYLQASRSSATRRQRGAITGVTAMFLVAALFAGIAVQQRGVAVDQRALAVQQAKVAEARGLDAQAASSDDISSVQLARQAVALDPTIATQGALLDALLRQPAGATRVWTTSSPSWKSTPDWIDTGADPSLIAVGDDYGDSVFLDTTTGATTPMVGVRGGSFIGDGRHFLGINAGDTVKARWSVTTVDAATGRGTAQPLPGSPYHVQIGSDGLTMAVISAAGTTVTFRRITDMKVTRVVHSRRQILDVQPLSGGRFVTATSVHDNPTMDFFAPLDLELWGASDTPPRQIASAPHGVRYAGVVSDNGRFLAQGLAHGRLRIEDLATGSRSILDTPSAPSNVVFSPDSNTLALSGHGWIQTWSLPSDSVVTRLTPVGTVEDLAFGSDGATLYSVASTGQVTAWDLSGTEGLRNPFLAPTGAGPHYFGYGEWDVWSPPMAVSPDGSQIVLPSTTGKIERLDASTLQALGDVRSSRVDTPLTVAFSPDGKHFIDGGMGGIEQWDTARWQAVRRLKGPPYILQNQSVNSVSSVAYSPDGTLIAAGDLTGHLYLWNAASGRAVLPPIAVDPVRKSAEGGSNEGIVAIVFSPGGKTIAVLGESHTISSTTASTQSGVLAIVDATTGSTVRSVETPNLASALGLDPSGRLIAVGSQDGAVHLIDAATDQIEGAALTTTQSPVSGVAFSPSGDLLAVASQDGSVRLYDVASRREIGSPFGSADHIGGAAVFMPGGSALALLGFNGSGELLDVRPGTWAAAACSLAGPMTSSEWQDDLPGVAYAPAC